MSNIVLLIFTVISTSFFTETAAQVLCTNEKLVGEIRVLNSRACVNILGTDGQGRMATYECDGYDDQQHILCGDGTLRNQAAPQNCATPGGTDGKGTVYSIPCKLFPSIPNYQKWDSRVQKTFVDDWGIKQVVYTFINRKSGQCLDVSGHDGTGRLKTYRCHGKPDQSFYFRSRGKLMIRGRLQNEKSDLCMDNNMKSKYIRLNNCHDIPSQYFRYYENGELLNDNDRLCVDVGSKRGTGDLRLDDCADRSYQIWSRPTHACNGEYCPFVNGKSKYCMNTKGYAAKYRQILQAYKCDQASDQRYKWVTETWESASAEWVRVGCNQNGEIEHTIENTVTSSTTLSVAVSVAVTKTIESSTQFHKSSLSTTITTTLAKSWTKSRSGKKSVTYTCKNYDSGEPFIRGCMWRLVVSLKEKASNNILVWSSQIVKCTSSQEEPTCPPFTKCLDDECTKCEDLPRKRSLPSETGESFLDEELFNIQNK
jgi:hypothetical protein